MTLFEPSVNVEQDLSERSNGPELPCGRKHERRLINQDNTSVSDSESSVGPIDLPDVLEGEAVHFIATAVQEMESLARHCIAVEEAYQRYFMRNCLTQREEAAWRQQGLREEATSRSAAKAISQVHLSELWARVGYYNTEAAQRSNLFRMLLLEKRSLDGHMQRKPSGPYEVADSAPRAAEKRRRRPGPGALPDLPAVVFSEFAQLAAKSRADPKLDPSSTSVAPVSPAVPAVPKCRTALVHNPYSFDGPSQISVMVPPTSEASAGQPTAMPASGALRTAPLGAMGAVLKRLAHTTPSLPEAEAAPAATPPAPDHPDSCAPASRFDLLKAARPPHAPRAGLGPSSSRLSTTSGFESTSSAPTLAKVPVASEVHKLRNPEGDAMRPFDGVQPHAPCGRVPEPADASSSLDAGAGGLEFSDQGANHATHKVARRPPSGAMADDEGQEDEGPSPLLSHPICDHVKSWKRLRANRGFAYFICYHCGAKWRTSSKGARGPPTREAGGDAPPPEETASTLTG